MSDNISLLSDDELLASTRALVGRSNELLAELVLHLAEVDERQLYRGRAFPSMFAYCVGELGFSSDVTCNYTTVIRLVRRFPEAVEVLRSGKLHLTGLRNLAPHLTEENWRKTLADACGKTVDEVKGIVATIDPKPDVPDSIRKLPAPRDSAPVEPTAQAEPDLFSFPSTASPAASPPPPPLVSPTPTPTPTPSPVSEAAPVPAAPPAPVIPRRDRVNPLAPNAYKVEFTASEALRAKLEEAKNLLRHRRADGSLAVIVEQALDLLIAKVKKERYGIGAKPRSEARKSKQDSAPLSASLALPSNAAADSPALQAASPRAPKSFARRPSRHIPIDDVREVCRRDTLQCTYVGPDGRRCQERGLLELDHIDGFARTGLHSVDRLRIRCKAHNALAAEELYGRDFMKRKIETARAARHQRELEHTAATDTTTLAAGAQGQAPDVQPTHAIELDREHHAALPRWGGRPDAGTGDPTDAGP